MRTADRPVPTVAGHRPSPERWPAALYVGVERQPIPVHVYDDYTASYDGAGFTYDDFTVPAADRLDLWCQLHGCRIASGTPDDEGNYDAAHVELTLDNRDGSLSQYDAMGRLVDYVPGAALDVWAVIDGEAWWLFSGHVTAWRELADGTVEAEAFDAFDSLNQLVPEWDPGVYGDTPGARVAAILTEHGYTGPSRIDVGDVTLHSYRSTVTPLDELHAVAQSDAGIVAVDADGTVVYRDRRWITGRADQTDSPVFTDNYCESGAVVVWEPAVTTDDDLLVNDVSLENVANVQVRVFDQASIDRHGRRTLPLPRFGDQWIQSFDGEDVARHVIDRHADHYLRASEFALYLHDRAHDLWATAIDRRLGDLITWAHIQDTTTGPSPIVLRLAVQSIAHEITPDTWVTTIGTTPTIVNVDVAYYDQTAYRYDDPAAVYVL